MNASVNIANINTQARTHPAPPNKATPSRTESGRLTYSTRPLTTANTIRQFGTYLDLGQPRSSFNLYCLSRYINIESLSFSLSPCAAPRSPAEA